MKLKYIVPFTLVTFFSLSSCSCSSNNNGGVAPGISISLPTEIDEPNITTPFSLRNSSGSEITGEGNVYTITTAGSYTVTGLLEEGQIVVSVGDNANVELILEGTKITSSTDSVIKALSGNKLEVKAKNGYTNLIKDLRPEMTSDISTVAKGSINSKIDTKFTGQGTLLVKSSYSDGVHCTKDVEIQNLTLQANGTFNAIKAKDSITVNSGTVTCFSTKGQGFKTVNSDVSSAGNQRGSVSINGGSVGFNVCFDAIDAAYNTVIQQLDKSTPTTVGLYTGKNSSYADNYVKTTSAKGIKAWNEVKISNGDIVVAASDDAIHANYGSTLMNGATGIGNVTISGGNVGIASGDDGIHADNTFTFSGGTLQITNAAEGIESNHISISDGYIYVYGTDDGVNASKKIDENPTIEISGGFLDVAVTGDDVDGIDSNGDYTQTGGVVVSRGSASSQSGLSTALDCDGTATISGGTFIAFNGLEKAPGRSGSVSYAGTFAEGSSEGQVPPGDGGHKPRAILKAAYTNGTYTLVGGDMNITFANYHEYSSFCVYSDLLKTSTSYKLSNGSSEVLSWTQTSDSQVIE